MTSTDCRSFVEPLIHRGQNELLSTKSFSVIFPVRFAVRREQNINLGCAINKSESYFLSISHTGHSLLVFGARRSDKSWSAVYRRPCRGTHTPTINNKKQPTSCLLVLVRVSKKRARRKHEPSKKVRTTGTKK